MTHYVIQCANVPATISAVQAFTGWQAPVVSADATTVRWGIFATDCSDTLLAKVASVAGVTTYTGADAAISDTKSRTLGLFAPPVIK